MDLSVSVMSCHIAPKTTCFLMPSPCFYPWPKQDKQFRIPEGGGKTLSIAFEEEEALQEIAMQIEGGGGYEERCRAAGALLRKWNGEA